MAIRRGLGRIFWTEATVVLVAMGPFLVPRAIMRAPWRLAWTDSGMSSRPAGGVSNLSAGGVSNLSAGGALG
jgi:hypothetical protein